MNLSSSCNKARVTNNPVISSEKFCFIDQYEINGGNVALHKRGGQWRQKCREEQQKNEVKTKYNHMDFLAQVIAFAFRTQFKLWTNN